jgi:hypothetical protein
MVEPTYKSDLSSDEKVLMAIVRAAEIFRRNVQCSEGFGCI